MKTYTQEEVDDLLDRQAAQTTSQILEKFKKTYSREEVEDLINSFANYHDINWLDSRTHQWIKENLK